MQEYRTSMQQIQINDGNGHEYGSDKSNFDEEESDEEEEEGNIGRIAIAIENIWMDFDSADLIDLQD
jgi:hypothetical protein